MDQKHDKIAKQIYDMILRSPNPKRCCQRELQGNLLCAISNSWLVFQNIKDAALRKDFSLVQIAYNKNEALLAAMADTDPDRKAFVEWASVILDATICQYFRADTYVFLLIYLQVSSQKYLQTVSIYLFDTLQ